jgi:non-lysosomal glucosylceramidase
MDHDRKRCDSANCGCRRGLSRREFLALAGAGAALAAARRPVMAGPFQAADFAKLVPPDKKLSPEWLQSLTARGTREVYRGADLDKIGMPVGGICAGQLYLGGCGNLWHWDIFNQHVGTGDGHYANPMQPASPLEQGFALRIASGGKTQDRPLDRTGFADITFCGEYPIGYVEYKDPGAPVTVSLEVFSPFIPLDADDSGLPATVLSFTVRNTSAEGVEATLVGWLENAVCLHNRSLPGTRRNRIVRGKGFTFLHCSVEKPAALAKPPEPDIVLEDWQKETYEGWTVEGTAFGSGPVKRSAIPGYQGDVGGEGERVVNSHATAPGNDVGAKDNGTGKLTGKPFKVQRDFLHFWIGGGSHAGKTCLNLLVDGKAVRTATGRNNNRMTVQSFDVRALKGKEAVIGIVDAQQGPWGNIGVGKITLSDRPAVGGKLEELSDYGTMGLAVLGEPAEHAQPAAQKGGFTGRQGEDSSGDLSQRLLGALGRKLQLAAGASATVSFVVAWHFPNWGMDGLGRAGRYYANRFDSAQAAAQYVADHFDRLCSRTRLWHDTWYDSTLPYWFLNRTFLNTSILATSTSYRLRSGRFWGWEGVGCCHGTCTHVWHYAHAPGRLFPVLERSLREMVDYGVAFDVNTGRIRFRAEHNDHWAVDGQSGSILRSLREHQMSADDQFLRRIWPRVKKSLEFLIGKDAGADGIIDGPQHNTLDADWFGKVAWLSSLYVAALRAGEAMAKEMGDEEFAKQARAIADAGSRNIDEQLFNGEYYVQVADKDHAKTVGSYDGCEIDQVFGQSWAFQVGLGRILPQPRVKTALGSLWKYNFTPDVGPYRNSYKPGRWYAMGGEAGLIMCTWPKGDASRVRQGYDYYFNECMNGFEYQAAGHMIWEGMLTEGLAVTRAVHDRYHPSRRNPWNEVECGDHYARSMASYGVFLAACGYEYHGPQGRLAFAPRLSPEDFRAAFTTAEGWGAFRQKRDGRTQQNAIELKHGKLRLRTLVLELPEKLTEPKATVTVSGKDVAVQQAVEAGRIRLSFAADLTLEAGANL